MHTGTVVEVVVIPFEIIATNIVRVQNTPACFAAFNAKAQSLAVGRVVTSLCARCQGIGTGFVPEPYTNLLATFAYVVSANATNAKRRDSRNGTRSIEVVVIPFGIRATNILRVQGTPVHFPALNAKTESLAVVSLTTFFCAQWQCVWVSLTTVFCARLVFEQFQPLTAFTCLYAKATNAKRCIRHILQTIFLNKFCKHVR